MYYNLYMMEQVGTRFQEALIKGDNMPKLDDWTVEGGKLVQELPEERLDVIIERTINRLLHITNQIQELRDKYVFAFGESSKAGAQHIIDMLKKDNSTL